MSTGCVPLAPGVMRSMAPLLSVSRMVRPKASMRSQNPSGNPGGGGSGWGGGGGGGRRGGGGGGGL
eukprot:6767627-Prymnesium_polylepis.1